VENPGRAEAESSRDKSPPTCNDELNARNLAMASPGQGGTESKDQSSPWRTIPHEAS